MNVQRQKIVLSDEAKILAVEKNTGAIVQSDTLRWQQEIKRLIERATNEVDRKALSCFGEALKPFLDDPKRLRTLLGKIAML